MSRPPGVAVVGTGFGRRVHVPALRAAGFEVRALIGRDTDKTARRAARAEVGHPCTTLADALALPGIDAVSIATPPATHAPLALQAIAAGRHVLCEKPFAIDATEASSMLVAAERAGVVHLVGHEFRFAAAQSAVARVIGEGRIGEPRTFTVVSSINLLSGPTELFADWWYDAAAGGGWLGASGSHAVDQLRTWLGEIESVSATLPTVSALDRGVEDSFVARLTTVNGAEGVLQQCAAAWTPNVVGLTSVTGTEGTIVVKGDRVVLADATGEHELVTATPVEADADSEHRWMAMELEPYTALARAFYTAIDGGEPGPVAPATFTDGVAGMRVLDAMRASAAAGGALQAVDPSR
ncbi:MAG TPA: Gfo/Idh/MocA family oxidoreductase [Acidimicrobiia bacterium]|nr:Gfo/Idh/MocA family oxidoreductase [Acidimicrobiia bacterium]